MKNRCDCITCVYYQDLKPYFRCKLNNVILRNAPYKCLYDRHTIGQERARKILHDYQKYRRGKGSIENCPPPYVIGIAIDKAIRCLRMF